MRLIVKRTDDNKIKFWWCDLTDCDTCPDRFNCYTSCIIIDYCFDLTYDEIRSKLELHGIIFDDYDKYTIPLFLPKYITPK